MRSISAVWVALLISTSAAAQGEATLPSWNDGPTKRAIVEFVGAVTNEDSPSYVPPEKRIATFDNDGCLWAEKPLYFQLIYSVDQVRQMSDAHPEWATTEPYKSAIAGDLNSLLETGAEGLSKIVVASHANITADEFARSVRKWLAEARHPETGRAYDEMIYQPMLELLAYLRANGFKTFIVSGGGIDFMRVFAEETYGIPPEQVIGSSIEAKFEMRDGIPTIVKLPGGLFVDDKVGKPVGIYQHIGRRPLFAAGNSDGDLAMLQYTTIPRSEMDASRRFGLIVHHTDSEREWAYDRDSHVGRLDKALAEASERGWTVVDMARDWARIFPEKN